MIVPYARHWSAPERRSTRTVCHLSEIVECRSPRFVTSLVKNSPNALREAWTPSAFSDWRSPRWHARRLGDGRSKRTRTDLAEGDAVNSGHDDQHHAFHNGFR